ncbi:MAG: isochorismate lyase [Rubrobacteraceae bacterium]
MKQPENCTGIEDIRRAIDTLDREIVGLIGCRARYVEAAARFKTGESSVRAPERQQAMLRELRGWAKEECLDPDIVEKMYKDLVSYFVNREMDQWRNT